MTARRLHRVTLTGVALLLAGCAVPAESHPDRGRRPAHHHHHHHHHRKEVRIPPGHLPPPGACRVWFRDRPPGHQPPPGPCHKLRHRVPRGAVLVVG